MNAGDFESSDSILESTWIDELHKKFTAFYETIEQSRDKILSLEENWDGEGAKGYLQETWERAAEFAKKVSYFLWKQTQKLIATPMILPGPDGSIDVHWKSSKFDLLVNLPEDVAEPATFSGDDYAQNVIKGTFEIDKMSQGLLYWLMDFL
ncbi:MAG TPA: hypothetical protein VKK79_03565 [Candidatus Lokiarchaeia archaeon]|nr:hypothetical protein [Candidatus Lokiarchaeia archaeon]